jgi:capsule polysaccharide export protein KpsE/RkpR
VTPSSIPDVEAAPETEPADRASSEIVSSEIVPSEIDSAQIGSAESSAGAQFRPPELPVPKNGHGVVASGVAGDHVSEIGLSEIQLSEISDSEIWQWAWLLWERRPFLARVLAWGLAVSLGVALLIPKRYQSTTRLMPPDGASGSGLAMLAAMARSGGMPAVGSLAGDALGIKSSGAVFQDILRSRTVEDRIVGRFDLRKVYHRRYGVDARKHLAKNTEISEDRKSSVITITVTDHDPRRAAAIAEAYVEELDRLVAEVSTSSARRERIFIENRLAAVKQDLERAAEEFSRFSSDHATLDISTQGKAMVEAAARLQGELIASESELEGLEQIYAPNNVRVRSLRARVEELSRQLEKLGGESTASPASGSGGQTDGLADAAGFPSTGFPSIRQLPLLGVRWADLYRQTKIEETVYELLTQQYELAKIEEAKEIPTVKILDPADVPEKKSFPPRILITLLGGLLSLCSAAVIVIAGEAWRTMDARDPRKRLAQTIWASGKKLRLRDLRRLWWAEKTS